MSLSKADILSINDITIEPVEVPEWGGGTVYVKVVSAKEREQFETLIAHDKTQFRTRLVAACLCDEDGKLLFDPADHESLSAKSSKAILRVFEAAYSLNFFGADGIEDQKKG